MLLPCSEGYLMVHEMMNVWLNKMYFYPNRTQVCHTSVSSTSILPWKCLKSLANSETALAIARENIYEIDTKSVRAVFSKKIKRLP